jgi:hypothetical protein
MQSAEEERRQPRCRSNARSTVRPRRLDDSPQLARKRRRPAKIRPRRFLRCQISQSGTPVRRLKHSRSPLIVRCPPVTARPAFERRHTNSKARCFFFIPHCVPVALSTQFQPCKSSPGCFRHPVWRGQQRTFRHRLPRVSERNRRLQARSFGRNRGRQKKAAQMALAHSDGPMTAMGERRGVMDVREVRFRGEQDRRRAVSAGSQTSAAERRQCCGK